MPREHSATEQRNIESVNRLFAPPPGFDVATLFADDAVWWNGCFVFRFRADGKIAYLTEHWNTWWADRFLFDQRPPEPARPLPPRP